ncbi:MAG: cytochrome c-type biogenesis protein CcmH [Acidobacteriota bacterium]
MRILTRPSRWTKSAEALILALAICFTVGATNSSARFNNLNHRLMCTCGCAELLGECNHVGCTASTKENAELRAAIAAGETDQQIFAAFTAEYGATVLAAPPTHGFDLVAWIAPFAVFAAALLGTILLIRRWGGRTDGKTPLPAGPDPAGLDPEERARRERIRRETNIGSGIDGGF